MTHVKNANHPDKESLAMLIIDRFEGEYAVIETDSGMINVPRSEIPPSVKEGDVLRIIIDTDETASRKERIEGLMDKVFRK